MNAMTAFFLRHINKFCDYQVNSKDPLAPLGPEDGYSSRPKLIIGAEAYSIFSSLDMDGDPDVDELHAINKRLSDLKFAYLIQISVPMTHEPYLLQGYKNRLNL